MICSKHIRKPIKIYDQCVGCEIEHLRYRVEELEKLLRDSAIESTECARAE